MQVEAFADLLRIFEVFQDEARPNGSKWTLDLNSSNQLRDQIVTLGCQIDGGGPVSRFLTFLGRF